MSGRAESRIVRLLASPRLAAWTIGVLGVMAIVNVTIPQHTYSAPSELARFAADYPVLARIVSILGLDRVFSGWPVLAVGTVLFANLLVCTIRRLPRGEGRVPESPGDGRGERFEAAGRSGLELVEAAAEALSRSGWRVSDRKAHGLLAVKGASGFWGSILLHVSLLVLIVGGTLTPLTTFRGEMVLAEGQTLQDVPSSYVAVVATPAIGPSFTGSRYTLDRVDVAYDRGVLVRADALMSASSPAGAVVRRVASVNHPLDIGGRSLLLLKMGLAADVTVQDSSGVRREVVNLGTRTPQGWRDSLRLSQATSLEMTAAPVPLSGGAVLPDEQYVLRDPRLTVGVPGRPGSDLARGRAAEVAPGVRVTLNGIGLWTDFLVRGEPARWIVYVGFWLLIAGAAWRFLVPERRLLLLAGDGWASVAYRARPWSLTAEADRSAVAGIIEAVPEAAEDTEAS